MHFRQKVRKKRGSKMAEKEEVRARLSLPFWVLIFGLIALLDPYLFKSCGYGPLTNLNTKQPPMF